ncbi:cardiolipin synthase [Duganella qianjiadongensis]|uniref:Cardiolipin synthase n=1 Tax=Duganella qianjiadongensis TaxID=2692176 RepID=A0ABW9VHT5_9BURK|nr:cardiolipin synthase [Duganella qianjiadongensis]MYM38215.1 cardiolipin synthase [Duganella qianjiadongensis]
MRGHGLLALALLCCSLFGACASLPQLAPASSRDSASMPALQLQGAQGELSAARARALLAKRWPQGRLDPATLAALEQDATGVPLIVGNRCTLLFDGPQTMGEMLKAIRGARNHINLETYIFDQDELGLEFAEALMAKQRQGVTVNILYDSVGTLGVPAEFFQRMREAGIRLLEFNPVNPAHLRGDTWQLNQRDHRKVLIVDGRVAFTGGINISASYARSSLFHSGRKRNAARQPGWRDTHIKVEGPAVRAFQWLFVRQWATQDSQDLPDADYFPPAANAGDKLVRVLGSDSDDPFDIYKAYQLAFQQARTSIHLTSAYFVPDPQTIAALTAAARRGVDVRIILPGVSDSGLVFYAGHAYYDQLLDSGVKIYHLKLSVLHAKTAVIDGLWSTVGSTNIDTRSFMHNSELNVVVLGAEFGQQMEAAFQEDLRNSGEITRAAWQQRPWLDRLREWAASLMHYWL